MSRRSSHLLCTKKEGGRASWKESIKSAAQFAAARKAFSQELRPMVGDPGKYQRVFQLGFGLWLDHDWRKHGWDAEDLSQNSFSPDTFGRAAQEAFRG